MKLEIFQQRSSNLFAENRLLKFGLLTLIVISIMNWTAMQKAIDSTRTVIYPVGMSTGCQYWANGGSDECLRAMARYVTNQVGNYTASGARQQFEELLVLFAPESHSNAREYFDKLAAKIERYPNVSSRMVWSGNNALKKVGDDKLVIKAQKARLVNGDTSRTETVTYEIKYEIRDARFWVLHVKEMADESKA